MRGADGGISELTLTATKARGHGATRAWGTDSELTLTATKGYAGWTAGQLEDELRRDTWVVSPLVADLLEDSPDEQLWRDLLGQLDDEWRLLANEPDDPSLN